MLISRYRVKKAVSHKVILHYPIRFKAFVGQISQYSCIPINWIYDATEPETDLYSFQPSPPLSTLSLAKNALFAVTWEPTGLEVF